MSAKTFYIGLDIGNGTTIAYTNDGDVDDVSFVPSMESTGDQIRKISMGQYGLGEALSVPPDMVHLNGNERTLVKENNGSFTFYGLSCMNVAKTSYNPTGVDRYKFVNRFRGLAEKAILGLKGVPFGRDNNLYLGLGMAPGFYTDEKISENVSQRLKDIFVDYSFTEGGRHFNILDVAITAEGFGAYYSHVTDLSLKTRIHKDRVDIGYLIIDGGRGTFDTMIIKNFKLSQGDRVESVENLGTTHLFSQIANAYNRLTNQKLNSTDIEFYHYVGRGKLLKEIDEDLLDRCIDSQKEIYLSNVGSYLQNTYSDQIDYFTKIIVTGGITKIFDANDSYFVDMISLADKEVLSFDVSSNAKGFYNVARIGLPKKSK